MEINWRKLADIIKTRPYVGNTDSGLSRALGTTRMVINNWKTGERDLPFLQKARMLEFAGYKDELTQMLSILPGEKQRVMRMKLKMIANSWDEYVRENHPEPIAFPPFGELIMKEGEAVKLPLGRTRVLLDEYGFPLEDEIVIELESSVEDEVNRVLPKKTKVAKP